MEQAAVAYLSYLSPEGVLWKNGVKKKKPSKHLRLQEYDCVSLCLLEKLDFPHVHFYWVTISLHHMTFRNCSSLAVVSGP